MAEHFNHTKVATWQTLTDSERDWAGYLARRLDDSGFVTDWHYGTAYLVASPYIEDAQKRYETWCRESILASLLTDDIKVALRSLIQAAVYLERWSEAGGGHTAGEHDAFTVAQLRLEAKLVRVTP